MEKARLENRGALFLVNLPQKEFVIVVLVEEKFLKEVVKNVEERAC